MMSEEQQATNTEPYLKAKIVFRGRIKCLTGLHIGGVETGVDVGGIDKYVIRNPHNNEPYIPGSSLKGKVRSLVEYAKASQMQLREAGGIARTVNIPEVRTLFGVAIGSDKNEDKNNPKSAASKVLFRDAVLSRADRDQPMSFFNGLKYTERKAENTLARITAKATPRQVERVPAGTRFNFSLVVNVDEENKKHIVDQLELLGLGFELLRHDGLGGMVSRGYGQVQIGWRNITIYNVTGNALSAVSTYTGKDFASLIDYVREHPYN